MFVDASVITAILALEADGPVFIATLDRSQTAAITSPLALFEATLAVARKLKCGPMDAKRRVDDFARRSRCDLIVIDAGISSLALDAHARYGKGTGHPAQLNMGDCFAYACAKAHGVPLLYKGADFVHTDLA